MKLEDFKNSYMGIRIEDIDLGLILGNQYIIENIAQRRKKRSFKIF